MEFKKYGIWRSEKDGRWDIVLTKKVAESILREMFETGNDSKDVMWDRLCRER